MSQPLNPLETEEQRSEEIRRIILEKKGGYRSDTDIEICLVYCLTSLILQELLLFQLHPYRWRQYSIGPKHNNIVYLRNVNIIHRTLMSRRYYWKSTEECSAA